VRVGVEELAQGEPVGGFGRSELGVDGHRGSSSEPDQGHISVLRAHSFVLTTLISPGIPLLTIGSGFGFSKPFSPLPHLRSIAAVCARSAPQMLHP
jgi:hypothetical protein